MVSALTRLFGSHNLQLAEDVVQDSLLKAVEVWKFGQMPENPAGWLYTVAKNKAIDKIRRQKHVLDFPDDMNDLLQSEYSMRFVIDKHFEEKEIFSDQLRMMFACCHTVISRESQITLILKTLCGFSVGEISKAFVTTQSVVNKRLFRARKKLRDHRIKLELPEESELQNGLSSVLAVIYLLFNEGYHSSSHEQTVRSDLCFEATRLCVILTEYPATNKPDARALMALMLFLAARLPARLDEHGSLVLLKEQNRNLWNQELIQLASSYLSDSTSAPTTHYQIEAAIAGVHATAPSFEETNWTQIKKLYTILALLKPGPVVKLNQAIVTAQIEGPKNGIDEILAEPELMKMTQYHLLYAVLGSLYAEEGDIEAAEKNLNRAIELTTSSEEKKIFRRKIELLANVSPSAQILPSRVSS